MKSVVVTAVESVIDLFGLRLNLVGSVVVNRYIILTLKMLD